MSQAQQVNYQKRSNAELFQKIAEENCLNCSQIQNYIPTYKRFFNLNETNFNSINFNHPWFLSNVGKKIDPSIELYDCKLRNFNTKKVKEDNVFFKMAPLVDPMRFIIGKVSFDDPLMFQLPTFHSTPENTVAQFVDPNNAAYVDSLFLYLSSTVLQSTNFLHKVDYYGSYLAVKKDFRFNIFDDLEYLVNSSFFMTNRNKLFKVDDFDHILNSFNFLSDEENQKKKPALKISSLSSNVSAESISDEIFENVFSATAESDDKVVDELKDLSNDDFVITTSSSSIGSKTSSQSSCSSRTSYTDENDEDLLANEDFDDNPAEDDEESWDTLEDQGEEDEMFEEVFATIPQCPVHIIAMEDCEETFDNLILDNENLPFAEWTSALFQIIMILITYQKMFSFTHNDLHTNNVMWKQTNKKFLYYKYNNSVYKVPTFGRLFKIIDFGRSIFKYKDQTFCSDSFRHEGEAAGQYNTEPYYNDAKPRLDPNFSFDLCRLACSIFDYVVDELDDVKDLSKCTPIQRLITEWCLDDKGHNMLYKNNGQDRYPDFKLYKMIARSVHNHTPQAQLLRPEFSKYLQRQPLKSEDVIDIDALKPQFT